MHHSYALPMQWPVAALPLVPRENHQLGSMAKSDPIQKQQIIRCIRPLRAISFCQATRKIRNRQRRQLPPQAMPLQPYTVITMLARSVNSTAAPYTKRGNLQGTHLLRWVLAPILPLPKFLTFASAKRLMAVEKRPRKNPRTEEVRHINTRR